jgi:hypothetical protein
MLAEVVVRVVVQVPKVTGGAGGGGAAGSSNVLLELMEL